MSATTNPELLIMPLARDGEKNTLPETTGATTGEFSQQYGFQQINSTPLTAGGKAPDRKDMNGVFNLLGGINFFAQKGWTFHYDSTQDYYLGCVVIDPADGKRYECIADMPAGTVAPHEDTDGDYWRRFTLGDGVPIATILAYSSNGDLPSGYLLCDGSAVSRTMFPDLFSAIGTTYGSGDGSTTFNLPDYNSAQRFAQGGTVAGTVKSAGLPNITGGFQSLLLQGSSGTNFAVGLYGDGAFVEDVTGTNRHAFSGTLTSKSQNTHLSLDASRSSAIYGNSDTVQPPALTCRYIIKAFDGQTADSALIDITQYANELASKADRSLSNLTDAGRAFAFPSDTYIRTGMTAQGDTFVAPANGYVAASFTRDTSTSANVMIRLSNLDSGIVNMSSYAATKITCYVWVPVQKGQTVELTTITNGTTSVTSRFIYAQGEVPTA
jgi:microcystin-dependent protein